MTCIVDFNFKKVVSIGDYNHDIRTVHSDSIAIIAIISSTNSNHEHPISATVLFSLVVSLLHKFLVP